MTPYITPMRGKRVRLNADGRETAPNHADREGVIWGENRERTSWRIRFPGLKELQGFHKSFVEFIPEQETKMRAFPKLADLKPGDKLEADGGFTCLSAGQRCEVKADAERLYIECTEGHHYLEGQTDFATGTELVGLWRLAE